MTNKRPLSSRMLFAALAPCPPPLSRRLRTPLCPCSSPVALRVAARLPPPFSLPQRPFHLSLSHAGPYPHLFNLPAPLGSDTSAVTEIGSDKAPTLPPISAQGRPRPDCGALPSLNTFSSPPLCKCKAFEVISYQDLATAPAPAAARIQLVGPNDTKQQPACAAGKASAGAASAAAPLPGGAPAMSRGPENRVRVHAHALCTPLRCAATPQRAAPRCLAPRQAAVRRATPPCGAATACC